MTTTYNFRCFYRKLGVAYSPLSPVTVSVGDGINTLSSNSVTTLTTIVGERRFLYVGADNLNLSAMFHTDDTLCEKQDIFVSPNDVVPYNNDIASIKAKTDQLSFTVTNQVDSNTLSWKSEVAPNITFEEMVFNGNYFIGDDVRTSFEFRDTADNLFDPTVVTLQVLNPSNIITAYVYGSSAIVRSAVGKYYFIISNIQIAGEWVDSWTGTGTINDAGADKFIVTNPLVPSTQVPLF